MATSYMTSVDLINSIKRRHAIPQSQMTFNDEDFLAILNEELTSSLVPEILGLHEEYFTFHEIIPLVSGKKRYEIPQRAMGMKIRSIFFQDNAGNVYEMSQINSDDQGFFSQNFANYERNLVTKFYFEGNDIVLPIYGDFNSPIGSLKVVYYLRPNKLVMPHRVSFIQNFNKKVICDNNSIVDGDTVSVDGVTFIARTTPSLSNEFAIGATSMLTAQNLSNVINLNGIASSTSSSNVCVVNLKDRTTSVKSNNNIGFNIPNKIGLTCYYTSENGTLTNGFPSNIAVNTYIDLLQTRAGHKIHTINILLSSGDITGSTLWLDESNVPNEIVIGDYVASENECIIPQIPDDLHPMLAQKAASVLLTSLGDIQGSAMSDKKISELLDRQGVLMDNRATGEPKKVFNRNSLLRISSRRKNWG